ncbi:MAG: penicillin-binding transpeptidase domain-containing protein [Rhodococcus sp. (in: high G+C Gram-positive bacteria)]
MRTSKKTASAPVAVTALLAVTALVLAGCADDGPPQPETTAQQFVDAINSGAADAAAALTTDPVAASAALTKLYDGLSAGGSVTATPDYTVESASDEGGAVTLDATWRFSTTKDGTEEPDGEPKQWQYDTNATAIETDQGWRIEWNPEVLAPGLTVDGTVRYTATDALVTPKVFDRAGAELMSQQIVTLVNVDSTADAAAVASYITPIVPGITAESIAANQAAAQGNSTTVVTLRQSDLDLIAAPLAALPGVTLAPQTRLLTTDRALGSPALAGVSELWQQQLDDSKGWAIQSVGVDGAIGQLEGVDANRAPDIATTLDSALQIKAENALASLPQQAAIVALQPSTGEVLAVAQNAVADAEGPIALTGLYPPGSTFKTVTTSAALEAGIATPDTILPCPGTENIEGRQIPNDDNFDLGAVPLHTAFARSCNTTMGRLGAGLPADALQQNALRYGLGVDYVTPGLTTVTGNVPVADTPAQRVEWAIGQGQVTASPFGMALVASSIASGSLKAPTLISGQPGTADVSTQPLNPQVTAQLETMMRETVTAGTATQLQDIPGLLGKTGTAEFGQQNEGAHGWFVGIEGDLAFAVFVAGGQSSAPALEAAGRFLR